MDLSLKKYISEVIATFIMILFGDGAVISSITLNQPSYGFIMVAWGIGVILSIYIFGGISGAQMNPVVSFSMVISGRMRFKDFFPYTIAQIFGAFLGAGAVWMLFGNILKKIDPAPELYANIAYGFFTEYPNPGFWPQYWPKNLLIPGTNGAGIYLNRVNTVWPLWIGWLAEFLMSAILILVILSVTNPSTRKKATEFTMWMNFWNC